MAYINGKEILFSPTVNVSGGSGEIKLQRKTATPSATEQTITADAEYDGLLSVTVEGDANLKAENIAEGVSIFGVTGTHSGGGDLDALIDGSITEVSSGATKIASYGIYKRANLTHAVFPNASEIGTYGMFNCEKLISADFANLSIINSYGLASSFSLKALILRKERVCNLTHTNALNACYHILGTVNSTYNPNGDKDGYFYVPANLVEQYRNATNWSTYATRFRALEDYTVDGTITGELDWDKVASGVQPATPEYLFKDERIDGYGRTDLPSLYSGDYIGTTFTLVVDGEDIETRVFNGTDLAEGTQWIIGSLEYELVFESGKEDVWFTTHTVLTCSLRIDN